METKHTPGPWRVAKMRAMTGPTEEMLTVEGGIETDAPERVARVGFEVTETAEADARLIAAAPELLAALQQTVAWMEGERTAIDALANARAIIAKATTPNELR